MAVDVVAAEGENHTHPCHTETERTKAEAAVILNTHCIPQAAVGAAEEGEQESMSTAAAAVAVAVAVEQENTNPSTVHAVAVAETEACLIQTSLNCPNSHRDLSGPAVQVGVVVEGTTTV